MKLLISFISIFLLGGCNALKDQAKSRELLAKCEYSLEQISVENISYDQIIKLVDMAKEVDFNAPDSKVLPLLNEIRKMNFDVDFTTLDFKATIGIANPNAHEVILDSLVFDAFLDGVEVANVMHDGATVKVPAQQSGQVEAIMTMPTSYQLKKILNAQEVNLKGKVWLRIELIKGLPVTIPFKFDVTKEVPREEIQKLIDQQKRKIAAKIVKELLKGKASDLLKF